MNSDNPQYPSSSQLALSASSIAPHFSTRKSHRPTSPTDMPFQQHISESLSQLPSPFRFPNKSRNTRIRNSHCSRQRVTHQALLSELTSHATLFLGTRN